jgi:hypothetical protein
VGEGLAVFGRFENHPALVGWSAAERAEVAAMCDNSATHLPLLRAGMAANHWAVLVRAEVAKERLGLPVQAEALAEGLTTIRRLLARNPLGFFDDDPQGSGRYDLYTPDMALFVAPVVDRLDRAAWERMVAAQVDLVETLTQRDGTFVAWGRSTGALSVVATVDRRPGPGTGPGSPRAPAAVARPRRHRPARPMVR